MAARVEGCGGPRKRGRVQANHKWVLRAIGVSGQVGQRWGLEPLTLMGRGLNCLEGERQREGAIWCLEVEDDVSGV